MDISQSLAGVTSDLRTVTFPVAEHWHWPLDSTHFSSRWG